MSRPTFLAFAQTEVPFERARRTAAGALKVARRELRRTASWLYGPRAGIVFHAGYAPPDSAVADQRRGAKIMEHLFADGWLSPSHVRVPRPLDLAALRRVHDDAYLESLDAPSAVARALGGDEPPPTTIAAGYLSAQRWATAGTVLAARMALSRSSVVVNVGGGFHHAERARGGGFCLFHDVAVAIEDLRSRGFHGRVLIVDLDLHHGDGTRRIYGNDPAIVAASAHAQPWDEGPASSAIDFALGSGVGDATYLTAVRELLDAALARGKPDFVFYVAGVDVAIDDTLGSWRVSADAIAERDRMVISRLGDRPFVMVLAGGYGQDAWRHSARTLVWLLSGQDVVIPDSHEVELHRFRRTARALGEEQLAGQATGGEHNFGITEADILGDLTGRGPHDHLLGYYTTFGVELIFERYGMFDLLRKRGYPHVRLELQPRSGVGDSVTMRTDDEDRLTLVELVIREMREVVPYRLLSIEWLLLQDPRARPKPERPLLPGQQHPGLGALRIMMGMLSMAAERLELDGLTFLPAHYHGAAQARGVLRFLDPRDEAVFVTIKEAVGPRSLLDATRLVSEGRLIDQETGVPFTWKPARMVIPISGALWSAVSGPEYDRRVEQAIRELRLHVAAA